MRYPTAEEVARINLDLTGRNLIRDPGLLASAVGRPQAGFGGQEVHDEDNDGPGNDLFQHPCSPPNLRCDAQWAESVEAYIPTIA